LTGGTIKGILKKTYSTSPIQLWHAQLQVRRNQRVTFDSSKVTLGFGEIAAFNASKIRALDDVNIKHLYRGN
jgi:hypothetical protein